MQKLYLAAIGAAALAAVPALAQTSSSPSSANGTSSRSSLSSSNTGTNNSSSTQQMSQADMTQLQQKITGDLQKDGYTQVRVVPNSFLIHAMNKTGEPVVMIINPDSVFAITDVASGSQGSPNGTGQRSGSGLGSSTTNPGSNGSNTTTKQ